MSAKVIAVCLLVLVAAAAHAEVFVWSNPEVAMWNTYPVEFPSVLTGIVSVELHMAGNSGASRGACNTPGGSDIYEQPWAISILLEGLAVARVTSGGGPIDQDYEVTVAFELVEGQTDWSFLEDGVTSAEFRASGITLPGQYPMCNSLVPHYPTVEAFDIIVTTDSVPTEGTSWTTVKALYR